jgi:hypothetical protein
MPLDELSQGLHTGMSRGPVQARPFRAVFSMSRVPVKSPLLFGVAFCLALLNAGTGSSSAQASCGDYVHLAGGAALNSPFVGSGAIPAQGMPAAEHGRPDGRHCQGPQCRRQNEAPGMPVPSPESSGQQQLACLNASAAPAGPECDRLTATQDRPLRESSELRIDRPPRRGS